MAEDKPLARSLAHDFIKANAAQRERLWVRVNPFDGPHTLADLAAIMPAHPGGIMLPKVYDRADVEKLDHCLSAIEVANGIEEGSTPVIVLINEAFTPSAEESAEARAIVAIFDANPGVGAIGYKGGMLDRPYLSRAQQLLAQVDAA